MFCMVAGDVAYLSSRIESEFVNTLVGTDSKERKGRVTESWISNKLKVLITTSLSSVGIDNLVVNSVLHVGGAFTTMDYIQQVSFDIECINE